jgi:ceramide glucosyltransferase
MHSALTALAVVCSLLAAAGTFYFWLSVWAARRYLQQRRRETRVNFAPSVSILKSLKGLDPHMYAAFHSHCTLDYGGEYEVLFGASDPEEPALALVAELQAEFPARQLRVVHCPQQLGLNGKVSNLVQMLPQARYDYVLINDSDILVQPDYLQRVMSPFADAKVGMTTTLYRARAGQTVWSKIEALGISTDFAGGVLVARELEGGIRFGLGATIATTKAVLEKIGGLQPLVDYLGDDYELGARAAQAGYRIELANVVVETALPDYSFAQFWKHQLRWARNVKDRRPAQYIGLVVSFALPWALLAVVAAPGAIWTWLVLVVTLAARLTSAFICGKSVLRDQQLSRDGWLIPFRDIVALAIWIASFAGNSVEWRGYKFRLRNGKLYRE